MIASNYEIRLIILIFIDMKSIISLYCLFNASHHMPYFEIIHANTIDEGFVARSTIAVLDSASRALSVNTCESALRPLFESFLLLNIKLFASIVK